jgi:NAD(P)H-hydrate epimerase
MYLSRQQVREVDRLAVEAYGVPGVVLMENAGRGCAELLLQLGVHGPVVICCGKGNNGGDGFVIARHLDNQQIPVRVLLFGQPEELRGDAASNFQIIAKAGLPIQTIARETITADWLNEQWQGAEWLVDAIFGTGLSGTVRAPFDVLIESINASGRNILAVDIPSGLDCDTGEPLGLAVQAQHTATFVALKKGFANAAAQQWLGQVHVLTIGAPRSCVAQAALTPEQ